MGTIPDRFNLRDDVMAAASLLNEATSFSNINDEDLDDLYEYLIEAIKYIEAELKRRE